MDLFEKMIAAIVWSLIIGGVIWAVANFGFHQHWSYLWTVVVTLIVSSLMTNGFSD